jgi:hypothetical protein
MRDTEPINPAWESSEDEERALPGTGPAGTVLRSLAGATRKLSPGLFHWLSSKAPEVRVAWGARQYALRFDGVHELRREGKQWGDNPRSNYNDAVERRQSKTSKTKP